MIETLVSLFEAANMLSPIAIIGLLVGLLYVVLYKQKPQGAELEIRADIESLRQNDLHELVTIAETLQRVEVSQAENFSAILTELRRR